MGTNDPGDGARVDTGAPGRRLLLPAPCDCDAAVRFFRDAPAEPVPLIKAAIAFHFVPIYYLSSAAKRVALRLQLVRIFTFVVVNLAYQQRSGGWELTQYGRDLIAEWETERASAELAR